MTQDNEDPRLTYNPQTNCYEQIVMVPVLVQVEAKILRQVVFAHMAADEALDLSNPAQVSAVLAELTNARRWLDKPTAKVTQVPSLPTPLAQLPAPVEAEPPKGTFDTLARSSTYGGNSKDAMLREKLRHIPPHRWWSDGPLTETPPQGTEKKKKDVIYTARGVERKMIEDIRQEMERNKIDRDPDKFILDHEAQCLEDEWNQAEQEKLDTKIITMVNSVNSAGHA